MLIQYTKDKSSVSLHTSQFAQNLPEGPVIDPVLENFPLARGRSAAPPTLPATIPRNISTPKNKDTPLPISDIK